jgi:hypothetical protein
VFSLPIAARRVATVLAGLSLAATLAPAVIAAPPASPTLNPEPPDFYACAATGGGAICRAHTVTPYALEATGIVCGSGAGTFEILDSGARDVRAWRWYDRDGNLTRRERITDFLAPHFTNPLTGATLYYQQHNTDWDVLAVPGDLGTSTFTGHGVISVNVPGHGSVLHESGRTVVGPDGNVESQAGRSDLSDYYGGDTALVRELCAALGA